ncbi:MAG TPA: lasso peptide biosynthesis B2 protein [Pyrinomonadaceae bacterium]|nr:lasso peptide biosynthesis B2 protein [Pyrinomonadaceae bacterium]
MDMASLVKTLLTVVRIRSQLFFFPRSSVGRLLTPTDLDAGAVGNPDWKLIERTVLSVKRCCRYVPGATCLTQALTVFILLRKNRQPSKLRIGVEKDATKRFRAHAWVEIDGTVVIGDLPDLKRYTILKSSTAAV